MRNGGFHGTIIAKRGITNEARRRPTGGAVTVRNQQQPPLRFVPGPRPQWAGNKTRHTTSARSKSSYRDAQQRGAMAAHLDERLSRIKPDQPVLS
jgi:hypothetical protein